MMLFYFLGLGSGWGSAVLNSQTEVDFIKQEQTSFGDKKSYFVGGSTNANVNANFDLQNYLSGNSGKYCAYIDNVKMYKIQVESNYCFMRLNCSQISIRFQYSGGFIIYPSKWTQS